MLPDSIRIKITSRQYKVNDSKTVIGCWMLVPGRWFLQAGLLLENGLWHMAEGERYGIFIYWRGL
jgi:hypothetical protein